MSSKCFVAPELHINIDDDQGVKKGEGEMVEGRQEVKVVVILKIGFFNILSDFFCSSERMGHLVMDILQSNQYLPNCFVHHNLTL